MSEHRYGWVPSLPDIRDLLYQAPEPTGPLPPSVDLRSGFPPVYNQGRLGSCVWNALAGLIQYDEHAEGKPVAVMPSRLFGYYNTRYLENTVQSDAGCAIRDALKALSKWGFCPEREWPYIVSRFTVHPMPNCYTDAGKELIDQYQSVPQDLNSLKSALASREPVIIGFSVYQSMETPEVDQTGIVPMPQGRSDRLLGGHAVLLVGYDDATQRFTFRNSWGAGWGQKGHGFLPYVYLTNPNLSSDFWIVTFVP